MSEDSEHLESGGGTPATPMSHGRVLALMVVITVIGSLLSGVALSVEFSAGVLVGGAIALVSYFWLSRSLRSMFERAAKGEVTQFQAAKFFLRYVLLGAVLFVFYKSGAFPMIAILLGLASFAGSIVLEGLIRIFKGIISRKED